MLFKRHLDIQMLAGYSFVLHGSFELLALFFLPSAGKKICPFSGHASRRGRMGVTLSFLDHCTKTIIPSFMKFGIYLGLMLWLCLWGSYCHCIYSFLIIIVVIIMWTTEKPSQKITLTSQLSGCLIGSNGWFIQNLELDVIVFNQQKNIICVLLCSVCCFQWLLIHNAKFLIQLLH